MEYFRGAMGVKDVGMPGVQWGCLGCNGDVWGAMGMSGVQWGCLGCNEDAWGAMGMPGDAMDVKGEGCGETKCPHPLA